MQPRLLVFSLIVFLAASLQASEEDILSPILRTVTLRTDAAQSADFGQVTATYSHAPSASGPKLQDVSVKYGEQTTSVPRKSVSDHPELIIDSAQISCERGYDPAPWLYLSFQLRSDPKKRFYFAFTEHRFAKTFIHP